MDVIPAQDQTALSWLDMQAPLPVSYVSLGALQHKNKFLEMARGLVNLNSN